VPEETISFQDGLQGPISMDLRREWGDFILRRADGVAAYQLAVVVDDGASGVTEVVRGRDLLTSTPAQIWLYQCLGLPVPKFYHVPMLLAPDGRRLSKRDRDLDLGQLQKSWTPEQLIGLLAWKCGLLDRWEPVSAQELATDFSWDRVRREDLVLDSKNLVK
jgi:glutamyl-tRNA synthetase